MATRSYNGQHYQASTTECRWTTPDGFDFKWQTWEDAKLKIGRKKKLVNDADGTISGFTAENVTTDASIKVRLEEWGAFVDAFDQFYAGLELDQVTFTEILSYGNVPGRIRTDKAEVVLQEISRDLPKSQDALMVELPLLMMSFTENGKPRFARQPQ